MGEVVPRECMTNVLSEDNHVRILSSSKLSWERCLQEAILQVLVEGHAMEVSVPTVEPMREEQGDKEREDTVQAKRRGSSSTSDLVP